MPTRVSIKAFVGDSFNRLTNYIQGINGKRSTAHSQARTVPIVSAEKNQLTLPQDIWLRIFSLVDPDHTKNQLLPVQIRGVSKHWKALYDAMLRSQRLQLSDEAIGYQLVLQPSQAFTPKLGFIYLTKNAVGQLIYTLSTPQKDSVSGILGNIVVKSKTQLTQKEINTLKEQIFFELRDLISPSLDADIKQQQEEITYLLENKHFILAFNPSLEKLGSYFLQLVQYNNPSIQSNHICFRAREHFLNKINDEIIQSKISLAQSRELNIVDCTKSFLTRFPQAVLIRPENASFLGKITGLYLNDNHLRNLPPGIGGTKSLTILWVFNNHLRSLPSEIGQLRELKWLKLDNNRLSNLPRQLGQLRELTRLTLHNNCLKDLPSEIVQLGALERLSLGNNYLRALPEQLREGILVNYNQEYEQEFATKAHILATQKPQLGIADKEVEDIDIDNEQGTQSRCSLQ